MVGIPTSRCYSGVQNEYATEAMSYDSFALCALLPLWPIPLSQIRSQVGGVIACFMVCFYFIGPTHKASFACGSMVRFL